MEKAKQATWGGRFTEPPSDLMVRFSESVSFDGRLASFDIRGSQAHARMLAHVGILTASEAEEICSGLDRIGGQIAAGDFAWDPHLEDVHMNIERALAKDVPAAAKLHSGRSRNDQIATDMRLWMRESCRQLGQFLRNLIEVLVGRAEAAGEVVAPAYTHLQRAQPVLLAHHWLAFAEMLGRDAGRFEEVYQQANVCPLGSGALAGSTLPLDRAFVARELGFVDEQGEPRLTRNSLDAVADRDHFLAFASACAIAGTHLSRLAEDMILWSTCEFAFLELSDAWSTGSSLMPQKKNPDSFELIRGKSARLHGNLTTLLTLTKGLPSTYNRDLQEDKPPVFDSFDTLADCLRVATGALASATVHMDRLRDAASDPLLLATDLADELVRTGVPFREAHHQVGALVAAARQARVSLPTLNDAVARDAAPGLPENWREVFSLERALTARTGVGMPGRAPVQDEIKRWRAWLSTS